jgi:integrase
LVVELEALNDGLRRRGIRLTVQQVKEGLWLRGTLPQLDGTRKQVRISLSLKATEVSLVEAEARAVSLAAAIQAGTYPASGLPWVQATGCLVETPAKPATKTVTEWNQQLQRQFWQGKVRTSAAQRTWTRIETELKRLPAGAVLTTDLLLAVAAATQAGSRTRLEACKVYKRLGKVAGLLGLEQLDELRTPYEPKERQLPSDDLLVELLERVADHPRYGWITWAAITFGCRPSEVFSLQPAGDGTARVLTIKRKGKLPTWRTALALELTPPPGPRLVPLDVSSPAQYDSLEAKQICEYWQKWFKGRAEGLQLYDLRHCWAIRSIRKNLNASLAAKCMGHSLAVHHCTYHRWLEQADVAAVAASLAAG